MVRRNTHGSSAPRQHGKQRETSMRCTRNIGLRRAQLQRALAHEQQTGITANARAGGSPVKPAIRSHCGCAELLCRTSMLGSQCVEPRQSVVRVGPELAEAGSSQIGGCSPARVRELRADRARLLWKRPYRFLRRRRARALVRMRRTVGRHPGLPVRRQLGAVHLLQCGRFGRRERSQRRSGSGWCGRCSRDVYPSLGDRRVSRGSWWHAQLRIPLPVLCGKLCPARLVP